MQHPRANLVSLAVCLAVLAALGPAVSAVAQDLHPSRRPSPMGMARTTLDDGTYVQIVYCRPYERGRDNIFGTKESEALVPYGEVWRTGANEATTFTSTGNPTVAGQELAAGTYSFFTTPGPDEWTIHFNSALGLSGTARYNPETDEFEPAYLPENDVLTATVKATTLPEEEKVDQLTISFEDTEQGADMVLRWIRTEVRIPVTPAG
ncbi:MAG: DUF2911 domain-containing protein [Thermoanaerobaculia bacterium]